METFSPATQQWLDSGRRVTIDGRQIYLRDEGAGPVVVLMHGFPTSCFDWRGVIDHLRPTHRCIAFDFPGYGLSDKPDDTSYSLFDQADAVVRLLESLSIPEAHIVSHDMGTSVHCELLARAQRGRLPFAIRRSTFTNGSMLQWKATITPFQKMLASNDTLLQAMALCANGLPGHIPALKSLMKRPEAWTDEDGIVIEELMRHQDGHRRIPALAGYMRERHIHKERWIGALAAAGPTVQFVWAAEDPIAHIALGRELHSLCPHARFTELPGLGHFLIVEDPSSIAREIAAFEN